MKKVLAILLTLALVMIMMPASAFADDAVTLTDSMVTLSKTSEVYSGSAYTLPTVSVSKGTETTDYTVEWKKGTETVTDLTTVSDAGTYTVTVTAKVGTVFSGGTVTKTFTASKFNFNSATTTYTGNTLKTNFSGFDALALNADVTVSKSDVKVAIGSTTIPESNYEVTAKKQSATQIRITVTPVAGNNIEGGARYLDVTLTSSITDYKVWGTGTGGAIPDQTYTGNALTPSIYVIPKDATSVSKALKNGTDYKVEYSNNISGNGTATVTVTGMGSYTGTITGSFIIKGKSISSASVTASSAAQGETPSLTVKDGTKELTLGTDYQIISCDSGTIGTSKGKINIQGIGNYTGTKESITFNVVDSKNLIVLSDIQTNNATPYYSGKTQQASITIKKDTKVLTKGVDYDLYYKYTDDKGNLVKTTEPKNANTYIIYVVGKGNYATDGELYGGTFVIKPVPLDWAEIVLGSSTVSYSGTYVPKVTLRLVSTGATFEDADFKVEYRSLSYRPYVYVTAVEGRNLTTTGSSKTYLEKDINLTTRSLSNCSIYFSDYRTSKAYDGKDFTPTLTVKDTGLGKNLYLGTDYTVQYKNAEGTLVSTLKNAGKYSVIVTGINGYTGTSTLTYTIEGTDISKYTVTLKESSVTATGYAQYPVITGVTNGYYSKLYASDYDVTYKDSTGKAVTSPTTPGTYTVIVTGKNAYSGSTTATFRIVGLPQTITVDKTAYKVYADSDSFKITAKATGDGTGFTYVSSAPDVASVSATGEVTIHKLGRAKITVTTSGTKKYDPASDDVYVKVYPKKTTLTQKPWTNGKTKSFKVRWDKQDDVTVYQIRYSRDKSFASGTYLTKTVKASELSYDTQSTTVTGLKSGQRYYVKVRAVKEVYNDYGKKLSYYGTWSNWKSVVVK